MVRLDAVAVARVVTELTGFAAPTLPIDLCRAVSPARAAHWRATVAYLRRDVLADDEVMAGPLTRTALFRTLVAMLLETFPNPAVGSPGPRRRPGQAADAAPGDPLHRGARGRRHRSRRHRRRRGPGCPGPAARLPPPRRHHSAGVPAPRPAGPRPPRPAGRDPGRGHRQPDRRPVGVPPPRQLLGALPAHLRLLAQHHPALLAVRRRAPAVVLDHRRARRTRAAQRCTAASSAAYERTSRARSTGSAGLSGSQPSSTQRSEMRAASARCSAAGRTVSGATPYTWA